MASRKPASNKSALSGVAVFVLATCVAETLAGRFVFADPTHSDVQIALKDGLIEQNPGMANPANAAEFATRATPAGVEKVNGSPNVGGAVSDTQTAAPTPAATTSGGFAISKGIPIPELKRFGGGRTSKYPWGALEVGDSFFVPNKESSKFGSTLGTARKAFKDAEGKNTRNFRSADATESGTSGVRVWRTE